MITQTATTSFKSDILTGGQDLTTDTIKLALYTGDANLTADTTAYTTVGEVVGTGYTAGGKTCTNVTVNTLNGVAYVSFDNLTWTSSAFTCRGALIYNASKSNKSIAVLNFGSDKTCSSTFTVTLPANTYTSAIIRV
jgi:hypothetical protein